MFQGFLKNQFHNQSEGFLTAGLNFWYSTVGTFLDDA